MTNTLYGISNCDTVKKARRWLDEHQVEYQFRDFRKNGLNAEQVAQWLRELGWETLINRRSTTWKNLDPAVRDQMSEATAVQAILQSPTLIKRPLLERNRSLMVGFKAADYEKLFP